MQTTLQKILHQVARKYDYYIKHHDKKWTNSRTYFDEIQKEIQEVEEELKPNNTVHLEDECGDILRVYLNMLHALEKDGYISSVKKVFERCEKKYKERVDDKIKGILREETKSRQKKRRLTEAENFGEK